MSLRKRFVVTGAGVWSSLALIASAMAVAVAAVVPISAGGCARRATPVDRLVPDPAAAGMRLAVQQPPDVPGRRVSVLLDFDTPDDLVFVTSDPARTLSADARTARSGRASLHVAPGTRQVMFKLSSLLSGRSFPGDWTLAGAFLHCDRPAVVTMSYDVAGQSVSSRSVRIAPHVWTPLMLDLAAVSGSAGSAALSSEVGVLRMTFDPHALPTIHLDDVTLVDNHDWIVDTSGVADGWSVRRRGLCYIIEAPGRFAMSVPTAQAEQGGWAVVDAGPSRVRFASSAAPGLLSIYADGRMYWGGEFRAVAPLLADAAEQARQHASPAEITVQEMTGRLNRSTAGDANNDGYNETRGAYQLAASGPRLELTITPRTSILSRPVLEIAGLPPGDVLVNMEGRLITGASRLAASGDVLVELPVRLERPTLVNVRVQ